MGGGELNDSEFYGSSTRTEADCVILQQPEYGASASDSVLGMANATIADLKRKLDEMTKRKEELEQELKRPKCMQDREQLDCTAGSSDEREPELECGPEAARDMRPIEDLEVIVKAGHWASELSDSEIVKLLVKGIIHLRLLKENVSPEKAAAIRTNFFAEKSKNPAIKNIPRENFNFDSMMGACGENTVGYIPVPLGVAGPLLVDGDDYYVPLATTEGGLIASVSRGCKSLYKSDGVSVVVKDLGITRAPVMKFPDIKSAESFCSWFKNSENVQELKRVISEKSNHTVLDTVLPRQSGATVYLRFRATTGDAMGMNMISKAVQDSLTHLKDLFPSMDVIALTGNFCTDKKSSAVNWILGRGKEVIAEAFLSEETVQTVLKVDIDRLIKVNTEKNLKGSAMAGSVGGFNAQAANVIAAVYLATGQDIAQVVEGSSCITSMEKTKDGKLHVTCTLPCIEVGTIGGGTVLDAQKSALEMLNVKGKSDGTRTNPEKLAAVIGAAVVAGELSLLASLTEGSLVKAHVKLNRPKAR